MERETIRRALDNAGGVKKDAAELMGISQRALSYYLAKYRIDPLRAGRAGWAGRAREDREDGGQT